jgi:hypothetical protein
MRLHIFIHMHKAEIGVHHTPDKRIVIWKIHCTYCQQVFYRDRVLEAMAEGWNRMEEMKRGRQ